ncbi:MAG: hypothetical protein ACKOWP_00450 [Microbacteriaceae bacterium]
MSNRKAKQARQALKKTLGELHQAHPTPTWEAKSWSEYTDQQRAEMNAAGIRTEDDYQRVLQSGVRSDETNDFYWWLTNYGVGFYRTEGEFVKALGRRLGKIELDPIKKAATRGALRGDLSRMRTVYAWNLKRGDRYFASPYGFRSPEGRAWLVRLLKDAGVTMLAVDTVDTGIFDINDAVFIDLDEAA